MREDILRYFSTAKANLERNHSHESITTILGQLDVAAKHETSLAWVSAVASLRLLVKSANQRSFIDKSLLDQHCA
jgi:hypothetical protein